MNWIRKILKEGHKPVIELLEICDDSNWGLSEIYWIAQMRAWNFNITNDRDGGIGCPNPSVETKERMSKSHIGKKLSESQKEKLKRFEADNHFYGKKHSVEAKAKIKLKRASQIITEETKNKLRESLKGKNTGKKPSPEAIEKNRKAHLGVKMTPEAKIKLMEALEKRQKKLLNLI